jgi:hypothetical protein
MKNPLKNSNFITASEVGQYGFCPIAWYHERQGRVFTREEVQARVKTLRARKFLSLGEKNELQYLLDLLEAYSLFDKGIQHHREISEKTRLLRSLQHLIGLFLGIGILLLSFLLSRLL